MPRSVAINTSASGDTTLVAAPGDGAFIRVWGYHLISTEATSVSFKSSSTVKDGPMPVAANGGLNAVAGGNEPVFDCGFNEQLVFNQSVATQTGGSVSYSIIRTKTIN